MPEEILEITPTGGLYCRVAFPPLPQPKPVRTLVDCACPNGFPLDQLLSDIRLRDAEPGISTDGDIIRWGLGVVCASPLASGLAHDARFDDWALGIEDCDDDCGPEIFENKNYLSLPCRKYSYAGFARDALAQVQFLFQMIRGLRAIWHQNNDLPQLENLSADEQVRWARLTEADLDLCAILAAFQLRQNGYGDLWRYILTTDLANLAVTLCECLSYRIEDDEMEEDELQDTLGLLMQDWFVDDERLSRIDHLTLTRIDAAQNKNERGGHVDFIDVLQLGVLPDGASYLEYAAGDLISDEYYMRMEPLNRAHLRQIMGEMDSSLAGGVVFRDADLARKIFPNKTFETVV